MREAVLYGTDGCHLCEQAEALLAEALSQTDAARNWQIECIDIIDSPELLRRYAESIPVLRRCVDGAELRWPFDQLQAQAFLR